MKEPITTSKQIASKRIVPNKLIAIAVLVVSMILSMFVLYTPKPILEDQRFSSVRALVHIEEISREPHSVFDPAAHENVRLYIKNTLTRYLGTANVREYDYTKEKAGSGIDQRIRNLFGKTLDGGFKNVLGIIPGKSDTAIMLVGHYDSRGHIGRYGELGRSYGAADDGYAIGTMLEIANLYKGQKLENTICFLFTDAEEIGLYGAKLAAMEKDLMSKVGFVINLEARGISGAAYMFETSPKNRKVIEFYRKASLPVTYSLATAVYQVMPNYTDFTEFLKAGTNGINFAVLEGLDHYHTPLDNYLEVSPSSLQHYGEQIAPLVDAFVKDPKYSDVRYFDANEGSVFFTLFPNVFVSYSETIAKILHFVVLVLMIAATIFMVKRQGGLLRKLPKYAFGFLAALVFSAIISLVYGNLMALIGKVPYSITYVRMNGSEWPTLLLMTLLASVIFITFVRKVDTMEKQRTFLLFGISLQLAIALATGYMLPGASFLFFVPALLGVLALGASMQSSVIVKHLVYGFTTLISSLLIVPILYSFFLALTVGGTPILVVIMLIHLTVSLPVFRLHLEA